ncbi:GNAT family N-acetyltransferase [Ketogulonicigenium vulgare]|uniref:GNAT family N-acetyltransferase n=1 Tax=Ketogulonicigenium vulgare TaxID=92945 RepID=UPI002359B64E|nr:GNAT family N-acetyltransferase [Ketogulonicigenium vulgare]
MTTPAALATTHALAFTDQRPWSADEFADLMDQFGVAVIGDAHSFILTRTIAGEAEILTLATAPAHQRKGLARNHLKTLLEQRLDRVFLEVAVNNMPAIALYTAAGFQIIGRRRHYYHLTSGEMVDAQVMAWAPKP